MEIEIIQNPLYDIRCEILVIFAGEESSEEIPKQILTLLDQYPDYKKYGEINLLYSWENMNAKHILLIGTGKSSELDIDKVRFLSATAARTAQKHKLTSIAFPVCIHTSALNTHITAQAIVEGVILGTYQFNYYKSKKSDLMLKKLILSAERNPLINQAVKIGKIIADSVNFARDLVNHPAGFMTPTQMVLEAEKIALDSEVTFHILEKSDMKKENMQALLAVSQGSCQPPKMIVLNYMGNKNSNNIIAFVGKGVTFDSGGISIKPSENMGAMKGDMAGGAAVLGAMLAISKLKPKANIIGIVPCTENMPSGQAYRPGDIISSMSGKTIEIISTDAEGRLILADAITYARKLGATHIIDIATLTGACVVALGNIASGVITNNSALCQNVFKAASQTGEKLWELPNFDEYKELIKSDIADLKNSGGKWGGAITGGLFIAEFAESTPWVHIDIAGTSDTSKDKGYNINGATGVGVRTLVQLARIMNENDC